MFKRYDPAEVQKGWHGWRAELSPEMIKLPSQAELNPYISDDELDAASPRTRHCFFDESRKAELQPRRQLQSLTSQFERLTNSRGWRLLRRYGRIRDGYFSPVYKLLGRTVFKPENKDGWQ